MLNNIVLPAGTTSVLLEKIPGMIADAIFPRPTAAPVVKIFGKSAEGSNVIEPLNDADLQAIAQLFDGEKLAALTPEVWLPKLDAIKTAIGADIRWDIDNGEPKESSLNRNMEILEHKEELSKVIQNGELIAHTSRGRRIQPSDVVQSTKNLIVMVADLKDYVARFQIGIEEAAPVAIPAAPAKVEAVTDTTPGDDAAYDEKLAALFDPLPMEALEKMFPANGQWKSWVERADRNGLKDAAKQERSKFNPYYAAVWFVHQGVKGWDLARCYRALANNLPARSSSNKHLLTGNFD